MVDLDIYGAMNNARSNANASRQKCCQKGLDFEQQNADEIGNNLVQKESIQFWKC